MTILRRAEISDASSIAALSIEVWLGTYLRRGINGFFANYVLSEFTEAKISAHIAHPNEFFWVSDNKEGIDGFIRVSRGKAGPVEGCSDTEIATFYVQPRHQGKGIGQALLKEALEFCAAQGDKAVWLATNSENTQAIVFYLAKGFKQIGHTQFEVGDQSYLNNVYAYQLD